MIHRRFHEKDFFQMSNAAIRDPRLTWAAKGCLALMLSNTSDFKLSLEVLQSKTADNPNKLKRICAELENFGYLVRGQRREKGRVTAVEWVVDDQPMDALEVLGEFGLTVMPYSSLRKIDVENQTQENLSLAENHQTQENQTLENQTLDFRMSGSSYKNTSFRTQEDQDISEFQNDDFQSDELSHVTDGCEEEPSQSLTPPFAPPAPDAAVRVTATTPAVPQDSNADPVPSRVKPLKTRIESEAAQKPAQAKSARAKPAQPKKAAHPRFQEMFSSLAFAVYGTDQKLAGAAGLIGKIANTLLESDFMPEDVPAIRAFLIIKLAKRGTPLTVWDFCNYAPDWRSTHKPTVRYSDDGLRIAPYKSIPFDPNAPDTQYLECEFGSVWGYHPDGKPWIDAGML